MYIVPTGRLIVVMAIILAVIIGVPLLGQIFLLGAITGRAATGWRAYVTPVNVGGALALLLPCVLACWPPIADWVARKLVRVSVVAMALPVVGTAAFVALYRWAPELADIQLFTLCAAGTGIFVSALAVFISMPRAARPSKALAAVVICGAWTLIVAPILIFLCGMIFMRTTGKH